MIVRKNKLLFLITGLLLSLLCVSAVQAADTTNPNDPDTVADKPARSDMATVGIAIGSALAVGLCAIATGFAQSRIGAAGCGAIAEKPETGGTVILLVAIPETMVILGFVIGVVLLFTL